MVQLVLSSTKGNAGLRYFPHTGYLGLTPVRVDGVVRTRPDADTRSCLAKAISVSVRCYEVRVGRVSVLQSNCLVDYTQVLWTKPDSAEFEQIGALDLPFRITLPTHIAGFSTALFVDYRCMWRVEAVLHHAPQSGMGSRQIKHFDLPLVRYDTPTLSVPRQRTWSSLDSTKSRAPRIQYFVNTPQTAVGPLDLVPIPIHVQPLDASVSVRSASVVVERRIYLHDCSSPAPSSLQSSLTLDPKPSPSSLSASSPKSGLPAAALVEPQDSGFLSSISSLSTITHHSPSSSSAALLPADPSSGSAQTSAKVVVNSITTAESSGQFSRDENGIWSKTLTVQWPASKSHSRWAIGETISSDLVSVKYFIRTKITVGSPTFSETYELAEQELVTVSTNEAERQLALAKYQEGLAVSDSPTTSSRSKSKSPRRSRPDREDSIPPSTSSAATASSRSKTSSRRPHTSAGPRDKPVSFFGGAYNNSQAQNSGSALSPPPHSTSKRRFDTQRRPGAVSESPPSSWLASNQDSGKTKIGRVNSSGSGWPSSSPSSIYGQRAVPVSPPQISDSSSGGSTSSGSTAFTSDSYGGDSESSGMSDSMREWEQELAKIEMKSRRSSDLLGFFGKKKRPEMLSSQAK